MEENNMDAGICIGDLITLVSVETGGFLSASPESDTDSAVSCGTTHHVERSNVNDPTDPIQIINKNVITFEVCGPNKYKAERKLRKLQTSNDITKQDILDAESKAAKERNENNGLSESQKGRHVFYNQTVQLRSVSSQKYVDCSRKLVNLSERNGRGVQVKFVLKLSEEASNNVVRTGDSVTIERVKDSGQYLHLMSGSSHGRGVELSSSGSEFKISRVYRASAYSVQDIHTGEIIQIHHKGLECDLMADGSNQGEGNGVVHSDSPCRLLHVSTQRCLYLDDNNRFGLTTDKSDRRTVFALQPHNQVAGSMTTNSCMNLYNKGANCWLKPSKETFERNKVDLGTESSFLGTSINIERVECRMVRPEKSKHEAPVAMFQMKRLGRKALREVYYIQEVMARVKAYLKINNRDSHNNEYQKAFLLENLRETGEKLSASCSKEMKSFICDSGLLTQLFRLMEQSQPSTADIRRNESLYSGAADLIAICIKGSTVQHKLGVVQYLDFCVRESKNQQSPLNQKALEIIVEMFHDNPTLVRVMRDHHIDKILNMFQMDYTHLYFRLLESLCVCNGEPVTRNQIYITNKLLATDESQELCYLSAMGEQIGLKEKTVYVTRNNGKPWLELQEVYRNDQIRLYYHHQLVFFKVLCCGSNTEAVKLLTTELGYITFDHLKWSLMDDCVPPEHRTIYCQLLIVMFIEANRDPVFGTLPPAFDLSNLQQPQVPELLADDVIKWTNTMISKNTVLAVSNNDHNIFMASVLDLVRSLIVFGFYENNRFEYDRCMSGLMEMLQGSTAVPHQELCDSLEKEDYNASQPLRMDGQNNGIVQVIISALKVIELLCEKTTVNMLMDFLSQFKREYSGHGERSVRAGVNFSIDQLKTILLNLAKIENGELVKTCIFILSKLCMKEEKMFEKARLVQILPPGRDLKSILNSVAVLKEALQSQGDTSHSEQMTTSVQEIERLCNSSDDTQNNMNQMIVFNSGLLEIVIEQICRNRVPGDTVFLMIKSLMRGNPSVQRFMFDKLDVMLHIQHMTPVIVETLTQIFTGSKELCIKVTSQQVKKAVALLVKWRYPACVDLLHVMMHPYPGCTIGHNKRMVIPHLHTHKQDIFQRLDAVNGDHLSKWSDDNYQHKEYILSLLDLMATCAENDRSFRESVCVSVSLQDVLAVLSSGLTMSVKLVYWRVLTNVFVPVQRTQLLQHDETYSLIRSFSDTLELAILNTSQDPTLIQRCASSATLNRLRTRMEESCILYIFEGILPFLKALFCDGTTSTKKQYQSDIDNLGDSLQEFASQIKAYIGDSPQFVAMLTDVLTLMHTNDDADMSIVTFLQVNSLPVNKQFPGDQDLNKRFQSFTDSVYNIYLRGRGEAGSVQGCTPWNLPQSDEFKDFVKCFRANSAVEEYSPTSPVCRYLIYSSECDLTPCRETTELDVKCLQVLRSMLQDEIAKLPPNYEDKMRQNQKQFCRIREVQNILASFGCVKCVFGHLNQGQSEEVRGQALALLSDLAFNRNGSVQEHILSYSNSYQEDGFFLYMHQILQQGIDEYKERKQLWTSLSKQMVKRPSADYKQVKQSQVAPVEQGLDNFGESGGHFAIPVQLMTALRILGDVGNSPTEDLKNLMRSQPLNTTSYNLVADCVMLMVVLYPQLDTETLPLYTSVVSCVTALVSANADNQMTVVDHNVLDPITFILFNWDRGDCRLAQVLEVKQATIMLARSLVEMNHGSHFLNRHSELPKFVVEQIETTRLVNEITSMWKSGCGHSEFQGIQQLTKIMSGTEKQALKMLCCQYYLLLCRKLDLVPSTTDTGVFQNDEVKDALRSLEKKTASVELMKDGLLQKNYFTVDTNLKPSQQFQHTFLEDADRSTSSSKLVDLVTWSSEYADKLTTTTTLNEYLIGRLFVKAWIPLHVILFLLTLTLVIYISTAMSAPDGGSVRFRDPKYEVKHGETVVYVLGGVHIFISSVIFVYFCIVESPSIPGLAHVGSLPRRRTTKEDGVNGHGNWSHVFNKYHLEVNGFGLKSIYYTKISIEKVEFERVCRRQIVSKDFYHKHIIGNGEIKLFAICNKSAADHFAKIQLFLLCSIAGTIFDGYFFAYHLFHFIIFSSKLQKLAKVVKTGWTFLAVLGLLMLAIIYVHGIVIFLFFRDYWDDSTNERHTFTLFQCLISLLHHGLIERTNHRDTDFTDEVRYASFDLGFYLMVTILCLYLALGIIIDSFTAIRSRQEKAELADRTQCYICCQRSVDFEQVALDYSEHVKREHNLWDYMMFLVELDHSNPGSITGLENYVLQKLLKSELDFFPYKMSMSLGHVLSDLDLGEKMHQIELRMADIATRLARETEIGAGSFRDGDSIRK